MSRSIYYCPAPVSALDYTCIGCGRQVEPTRDGWRHAVSVCGLLTVWGSPCGRRPRHVGTHQDAAKLAEIAGRHYRRKAVAA